MDVKAFFLYTIAVIGSFIFLTYKRYIVNPQKGDIPFFI